MAISSMLAVSLAETFLSAVAQLEVSAAVLWMSGSSVSLAGDCIPYHLGDVATFSAALLAT
ncbi:hypothetical protein ACWGIB_14255 [Streptomyces xiamenensis]